MTLSLDEEEVLPLILTRRVTLQVRDLTLHESREAVGKIEVEIGALQKGINVNILTTGTPALQITAKLRLPPLLVHHKTRRTLGWPLHNFFIRNTRWLPVVPGRRVWVASSEWRGEKEMGKFDC
jgi:hypothetical protein